MPTRADELAEAIRKAGQEKQAEADKIRDSNTLWLMCACLFMCPAQYTIYFIFGASWGCTVGIVGIMIIAWLLLSGRLKVFGR